jgi:hypothetical protein
LPKVWNENAFYELRVTSNRYHNDRDSLLAGLLRSVGREAFLANEREDQKFSPSMGRGYFGELFEPETLWDALDESGEGRLDQAEVTAVAKDAWALLAEGLRSVVGTAELILKPQQIFDGLAADLKQQAYDGFAKMAAGGKVGKEDALAVYECGRNGRVCDVMYDIVREWKRLEETDASSVQVCKRRERGGSTPSWSLAALCAALLTALCAALLTALCAALVALAEYVAARKCGLEGRARGARQAARLHVGVPPGGGRIDAPQPCVIWGRREAARRDEPAERARKAQAGAGQ